MNKSISFIIVAYNSENSINHSLGSLVKQDFPHHLIEVILVDSNSSDHTKRIMLDFQKKETSFSRVLVLDNPGKYLACGWNVALKAVTGDVVLRVDAHTEFPSDFISKNAQLIENGKDICGGKVLSILQKDTPWNRTLLAAENSMFGGGFTFFRRGETAQYTNTLAFAAYKKEVFEVVGNYDERLVRTEDNEMHYRMRKAGFKFFFSPEIVSYRFSRSSLNGLLRQKFLNGYWVGLTHAVCPMAFSVFYLVPLLFVMAFIVCLGLLAVTTWPLLILLSAYAVVLLFALMGAIQKNGLYWQILALPFFIFALHLWYGIGTAKGLCEENLKMSKTFKRKGGIAGFLYYIAQLLLLPLKTIGWITNILFNS